MNLSTNRFSTTLRTFPADPNQLAYSVVRDAVTETGKPAKKRKREKEQILKDEIGKDSVSNQC